MAPPTARREADAAKEKFAQNTCRSDPMTILNAYQQWDTEQRRGGYRAGDDFCHRNFLAGQTLQQLPKVKEHLLSALEKAGVFQMIAGGVASASDGSDRRRRSAGVPSELNVNGTNLTLIAALIGSALSPNFAIRVSTTSYATMRDKKCSMHMSSLNMPSRIDDLPEPINTKRQIYAFGLSRFADYYVS